MSTKDRRAYRGYCLLLLAGTLTACTEDAPTSPDYKYAGSWVGTWVDHYLLPLNGEPFVEPITLEVNPEGVCSARSTNLVEISGISYSHNLSLDATVFPDGSVFGTGEYTASVTGGILRVSGTIYGQLDAKTGLGSGVLECPFTEDTPFHFPWQVQREGG